MPKSKLHPILPEDLYRLRTLSGCELSPDGNWLATALEAPDRAAVKTYSHLWLIPAVRGAAQQFTFGEQHDSLPRFSPDGQQLAFLSDRSGSSQVHLLRVAGGESRQLSRIAGGVLDFTWSPDGRRLCLTVVPPPNGADKPAAPLVHHFTGNDLRQPAPVAELHLLDVRTGRTSLLFRDAFHNSYAGFSPDGRWVVFSSNKQTEREPNSMRDDLWKIRLGARGKLQLIKTHAGSAFAPVVSPDGRWIAFRGLADPDLGWSRTNVDLYVAPFSGGSVRNLSGPLDRTTMPKVLSDSFSIRGSQLPVWSPDSRWVYSVVTDGGRVKLFRFALDGQPPEPVVDEPGAVLSFAVDSVRDRVWYELSDAGNPGDIYVRTLGGGRPQQRTRVNAWLAHRDLGRLAEIKCPASKAGPALEGWVLTPPDFTPRRKYPGILYIHGGPASTYGPVFMHEFHYLAGLGYAVFFCNPRGSHGYGAAFARAIHLDWGNLDYKDLMRFTDRVLKQCPFIDGARLGVAGGSYGGYMTNWIIGHTRRFKAAVTERSISNLLSWFGSSGNPFGLVSSFCTPGRTPWQEQARLLSQSPVAYLQHARTPTLVLHAEKDTSAPVEQGQQVYTELKLRGVETEYLRFPEEGHEMSRSGRTDRRIERLRRIGGWFDRHLRR